MLAVILPSRGLIHHQVLAAVDRETAGIEHQRFWSHGRKLPYCFNIPTVEAFDAGCSHFWFVEEDTVPSLGALDALLASDPFAACPYKLHPSGSPSWKRQLDFCWSGFGCTMVSREVLEKISRPWFQVGYEVVRFQPGSAEADRWELRPSRSRYSGHDVAFCLRAYQAGFAVKILEDFPAYHIPPKGES